MGRWARRASGGSRSRAGASRTSSARRPRRAARGDRRVAARPRRVKSNPDSPQWPVRQRALVDGKIVFMAVPRLAEARAVLPARPRSSSPTRRAQRARSRARRRSARTVDVDELEPVDLVVTGCVAVDEWRAARQGRRVQRPRAGRRGRGRAGGRRHHRGDDRPRSARSSTTGAIPTTDHDIHLDVIVTPDRVMRCRGRRVASCRGVRWDDLTDEKIAAIPVLQSLRP